MQDVFHLFSGRPMLHATLSSHPDRIPGGILFPYRMDFQKPVAPDDRHNAWKVGVEDVRGSPWSLKSLKFEKFKEFEEFEVDWLIGDWLIG